MMNSRVAIRAIDFLLYKNLDEIIIQFFGGEPTLNFKSIKDVADYLNKKKTKTKINYEILTNGLLSRTILNFFIKNFIKAYLSAKKSGVQIIQFGPFDLFSPSKFTCASTHKYKFVVMPNGEILFCLGAQEEFGEIVKEFKLGYCTSEKLSINESKAKTLPVKYNVDLIKECDKCFIKYICKGVCPALNAVSNGRWDISDRYSCYIRKGIIQGIILDLAKEYFNIDNIL